VQQKIIKMSFEEIKNSIEGKIVLIGLSFINTEGELIERYQTHGFIEGLTELGILRIIQPDNTTFQIPYDHDTFNKAEPGDYRARATGIIIKDPDFIISWEVEVSQNDNLEELKRVGYVAPEE
jgi:hypothetical protein